MSNEFEKDFDSYHNDVTSGDAAAPASFHDAVRRLYQRPLVKDSHRKSFRVSTTPSTPSRTCANGDVRLHTKFFKERVQPFSIVGFIRDEVMRARGGGREPPCVADVVSWHDMNRCS